MQKKEQEAQSAANRNDSKTLYRILKDLIAIPVIPTQYRSRIKMERISHQKRTKTPDGWSISGKC